MASNALLNRLLAELMADPFKAKRHIAIARALIDPGNADTLFQLACANLAQGQWTRAWRAWAGRQAPVRDKAFGAFPAPSSLAELKGKSLLLTGEQGFGDIIQFARCLKPLHRAGASLHLLADPRLHRLLAGLPVPPRCHGSVPKRLRFDFTLPLLDIPLLGGIRPAPDRRPYLAARRRDIRRHLRPGAVNIGIAWQGNPEAMVDIGRWPRWRRWAACATSTGSPCKKARLWPRFRRWLQLFRYRSRKASTKDHMLSPTPQH